MIAIKSKKELMFPTSYRGFIKMEVDLIQNKPNQGVYELRIIDTCFKNITEQIERVINNENGDAETIMEPVVREEQVGNQNIRFKKMTYAELDQLSLFLNVDLATGNLRENINELFRKGLLLTTQSECQKGEGMYFSEAQDWEIIR